MSRFSRSRLAIYCAWDADCKIQDVVNYIFGCESARWVLTSLSTASSVGVPVFAGVGGSGGGWREGRRCRESRRV